MTWTNVVQDLWCHMASVGPNADIFPLTLIIMSIFYIVYSQKAKRCYAQNQSVVDNKCIRYSGISGYDMLNIYLETAIIHLRNACGFRCDVGGYAVEKWEKRCSDLQPSGGVVSLTHFIRWSYIVPSSIMTKAKFSAGVWLKSSIILFTKCVFFICH